MGGASSSMFMILMIFGVFYFMLIRPQTKQQKLHQEMLSKLEKGDMIVTRGGLIGKISGVKDRELIIEIQEKVRVRVLRSHIDGKYDPSKNQEEGKKAA